MPFQRSRPRHPILDVLIVLADLSAGGAEIAAITLSNGLVERGYRVGMLLFREQGGLIDLPDPRIQRFHLDGRPARRSLVPLMRKIAALAPRTVLSFLPHANVLCILATALARTQSRVIVTEHNQPDPAVFRLSSPGLVWWLHLSRHVYPFASRLVCCSEGIRRAWVHDMGLNPDLVRVIYNPIITPNLVALSRQPIAHQWAENPPVPLIVAAGRLSPVKDFTTLIRAFARLRKRRPAHLVVLGDGVCRGELESLVQTLGIAGDVNMPGFVDNPFAYFRRADVVAVTSINEGFPNVIIEALACGTTVVATSCLTPTDQELVNKWIHATVPVGDDGALADALGSAIDEPMDPETLAEMVRGFSAAAAINSYEALLFDNSGSVSASEQR